MLQLAWALLALLNLATLAIYGFDKWRSRREGARRVPERTLLWFLFATGWIGCWIAMSLFRHKTVKASFRRWAILWTIVNPFWAMVWLTFA